METGDKLPDDFGPDDITGPDVGQTPGAAARDIDEALAALSPDQRRSMIESQLLIRAATFGVLTTLEERGITDARILTELLESIDPETHPLTADLTPIVLDIDQARIAAADLEEQQRLKSLSGLAYAVAAVATSNAVRITGDPRANQETLKIFAKQQIVASGLTDETQDILYETLARDI